MKIKGFSIVALGICFFCSFSLAAQNRSTALSTEGSARIKAVEDTLVVLGYAIVNDSAEVNRFAACKTFIPKLVSALKVENSFNFAFDRLHTVSVLMAPDSSFRIFTWQLFVNDSTYKYYGAIQINSPNLKLFPLLDRSDEIQNAESVNLTADRWYGALYYGIQEVKTAKETYYALFGFDAYSFFDRRKLIDILQFDSAGKPVFGKAIFNREKTQFEDGGLQNRLILEYSASTSIKCNYDEYLEMIIFDHLITIPNPFGAGMTSVTDGSYEGYKITENGLEYVEKIFNQVSEEAPSPEPVSESRKEKDIMGHKGKLRKD